MEWGIYAAHTVYYNLSLQAIRNKLDEQGAADSTYYELTVAIGIGYDKIALTQPGVYHQYLDAINLMAYDFHGGFDSVIGHQAALYANPNDTHSPLVNERYNIDWSVNELIAQGVPASKLVLGLAYYSLGWDSVSGGWDMDTNGTPNGMFGTGTGTLPGDWGAGGQDPYTTVKILMGQHGWELYRDPFSMVPWLYNRSSAKLYTFDDAVSIAAKCDYINNMGLVGVMMWELDGDDWQSGHELIDIMAAKMQE